MDIQNYHDTIPSFQNEILKYLDVEEYNENDVSILKYFDKYLTQKNGFDVNKILCLLRTIINNHHR